MFRWDENAASRIISNSCCLPPSIHPMQERSRWKGLFEKWRTRYAHHVHVSLSPSIYAVFVILSCGGNTLLKRERENLSKTDWMGLASSVFHAVVSISGSTRTNESGLKFFEPATLHVVVAYVRMNVCTAFAPTLDLAIQTQHIIIHPQKTKRDVIFNSDWRVLLFGFVFFPHAAAATATTAAAATSTTRRWPTKTTNFYVFLLFLQNVVSATNDSSWSKLGTRI